MRLRAVVALTCLGAASLLGACADTSGGRPQIAVVGGDPHRGQDAMVRYGCTSCHAVPGIPSVANDRIAPNLEGFDDRYYIAGQIPNRPEELIRWLQNPPAVTPGTVMPNLGVTEQDAKDLAAYLYGQ